MIRLQQESPSGTLLLRGGMGFAEPMRIMLHIDRLFWLVCPAIVVITMLIPLEDYLQSLGVGELATIRIGRWTKCTLMIGGLVVPLMLYVIFVRRVILKRITSPKCDDTAYSTRFGRTKRTSQAYRRWLLAVGCWQIVFRCTATGQNNLRIRLRLHRFFASSGTRSHLAEVLPLNFLTLIICSVPGVSIRCRVLVKQVDVRNVGGHSLIIKCGRTGQVRPRISI